MLELYRKVSKFSDAKNFPVSYLKFKKEAKFNLSVFCRNDANGITNSGDPDQTAPLGAV